MSDKKPGMGCLPVVIALVLIFLVLSALGLGGESDYEKAGKDFENWITEDPHTWTDTQKQYFDDFWEWSNEN